MSLEQSIKRTSFIDQNVVIYT